MDRSRDKGSLMIPGLSTCIKNAREVAFRRSMYRFLMKYPAFVLYNPETTNRKMRDESLDDRD
jgi:hypothetical protein